LFKPRQVLPEALVIAIVILARLTGTLQFLELTAFDTLLRLRPAEPIDERVVILAITEADIHQAKAYPLPDRAIAQLIQKINTYQPAVIGLDIFRDFPIEPGHADLVKTFQTTPNLIAIEKVLPEIIKPPPAIPPEQVGFADALVDHLDGKLRRSLLGTSTEQGDYRLSLSIRLAEGYLKTKGLTLETGIRERAAMRFGTVELPPFHPNSGGYINEDAGGQQVLINFRSGVQPFPILSLQDLQKDVHPDRLRGKIVLIGVMASSVKDLVNISAIASDNPALIYGVEAQAHAISQIVSAVLDGRPLIQVWEDGWDYLWIVAWGVLGVVLGRVIPSPFQSFVALIIASGCLVMGSYGLLLLGWWIPIVPAFLVLILNGVGLAAFYRYDTALRSRLHDRQMTIDQTFTAIHNGPLQTLAQLLRTVQTEDLSQPHLLQRLHHLNQELRQVYDGVKQEALPDATQVYLGHDQALDLQLPLHELLQEVYSVVIERDLRGFKTLKLKVVKFEPLNERCLNIAQKRELCRFLEETLCNVGKHAIAPTRLDIRCTQAERHNIIQIIDNGKGAWVPTEDANKMASGMGSQQAKRLARQLGGQFQRRSNVPQGMICELIWSASRFRFWRF
jgi:CHASE2 domain-containing sensor protein